MMMDAGAKAINSVSNSPSIIKQSNQMSVQLDTLTDLPSTTLRQYWSRLFKSQPPVRMSRDLLILAIGWKLQVRAQGGLTAVERRKLAEIARKSADQDSIASSNAIQLKPGTKLIREWHGNIHEVLVLEKGFEWEGHSYRSLTQIASLITGAHWSGPRFFGLKSKPDNFAKRSDVAIEVFNSESQGNKASALKETEGEEDRGDNKHKELKLLDERGFE